MLGLGGILQLAGAPGRAILFSVIILSGCPAVALSAFPSPQEVPVVGIPGAGGLGEVWRYTAEGRLVSRWTGLSDIGSLSVTGAGRLVVFQQGNLRLVEFDGSGTVQHVLSLPFTSVFQGTVLSNGHLLLAAGKDGAVELDGAGGAIWRAPAPDAGAEVVATVRLADGTTLCAVRGAGGSLYEAAGGSTGLVPVALSGVGRFRDFWPRPRLRLLDSAAQRVALWYEPWPDWYRLDWGKGIVQRRSVIPAKGGVRAIAPGRGGVTWVAETPFEVIRVSPSGAETVQLAIADEIRDMAGASPAFSGSPAVFLDGSWAVDSGRDSFHRRSAGNRLA